MRWNTARQFTVVTLRNRVKRQADLSKVVVALSQQSSDADALDGGHQESEKDCDNGDYHEQFQKGQAFSHRWSLSSP
jgi:hypothetical protein